MLIASNRIRILAQLARFIWMNVSVDAFVSLHPLGFGSMLSFINGLLPHQSDVSFRTFSWNQGKSHFHVTRGNCRNQYWFQFSVGIFQIITSANENVGKVMVKFQNSILNFSYRLSLMVSAWSLHSQKGEQTRYAEILDHGLASAS